MLVIYQLIVISTQVSFEGKHPQQLSALFVVAEQSFRSAPSLRATMANFMDDTHGQAKRNRPGTPPGIHAAVPGGVGPQRSVQLDYDMGQVSLHINSAYRQPDMAHVLQISFQVLETLNSAINGVVKAINKHSSSLDTIAYATEVTSKNVRDREFSQRLLQDEINKVRQELKDTQLNIRCTMEDVQDNDVKLKSLLHSNDRLLKSHLQEMKATIETKFTELASSESFYGNVLQRVLAEVKEHFDKDSELRTRFESVVQAVGEHGARMAGLEAWAQLGPRCSCPVFASATMSAAVTGARGRGSNRVRRKSDASPTQDRHKSDTSPTQVQRKSDASPTQV